MVNVAARKTCASSLRRFAAGLSTVKEFEQEVEDLDDDATEAFFRYAWLHYDDFRTERLAGRWRLSGRVRRDWARWALYLAVDDADYPWSETRCEATAPPSWFARCRRLFQTVQQHSQEGCDTKYWPFQSRLHLHETERRYLASMYGNPHP